MMYAALIIDKQGNTRHRYLPAPHTEISEPLAIDWAKVALATGSDSIEPTTPCHTKRTFKRVDPPSGRTSHWLLYEEE